MNSSIICPVCSKPLFRSYGTYKCVNSHSFDIAKEGYLNLYLKNYTGIYAEKELFASRRRVYDDGFFDPLISKCAEIIDSVLFDKSSIRVLDAGCGEGSFLGKIHAMIHRSDCVGIDIVKNPIRLASKKYHQLTWLVGDLCAIPLAKGSIDCILNILAPANYIEFDRLLSENSVVIKVTPNRDYLLELREQYSLSEFEDKRSNELFVEHFELLDILPVRYKFSVHKSIEKDILAMTPLLKYIETTQGIDSDVLTIDLRINIGRKKH